MKVKMYPATKRPNYMNGSGLFLMIWAYCIEYAHCKNPKETLKKFYLSSEDCSSANWEKYVKYNHIVSWCYYDELTFTT